MWFGFRRPLRGLGAGLLEADLGSGRIGVTGNGSHVAEGLL